MNRPALPLFGLDQEELRRLLVKALIFALAVSYVSVLFMICSTRSPASGGVPLTGLWLSTGALLGASAAAQWAVRSVRHGSPRALRSSMALTTALGIGFLLLQAENAFMIIGPMFPPATSRMHLLAYYFLAMVHAVHALGGIGAGALVTRRVFTGAYSPQRFGPIWQLAAYWHFLAAVWLILLAVLLRN
jgi:cytochrome c oxidase subunit III